MRVNQSIRMPEVRLIDAEGRQLGIVPTAEALRLADQQGMDLVEISPDTRPVVCKILDYGKHKYRESKKRHEARARQKQVEVKEIKLRLSISSADYEVKRRNIARFLDGGNRVKAAVWFRGREITRQEMGRQLLMRLRDDLSEHGDIDQPPNMEGRRLQMLFVPKRTGKEKEKHNAKNENL